MEASKEELSRFIAKIIELYDQEKEKEKQRIPMYILFSGEWDERYASFFQQIKESSSYQLIGILSREQAEKEKILKVAMKECEKIVMREEALERRLYSQTTVFPVLHRDILAKAALCIPDTFEVIWMQKAMESGGKLVVMANGLDPFTGKEPSAYRERVLSYIKTLLEFDIEIKVDGEER
ncbi:MAG: hypothetical protein Q4F05_13035 [bacterium]|nr:hypothetical protein [bacterium]